MVKQYIEENRERFLEELFELLRIPSVSAQSVHKGDMVRAAEWLRDALLKSGANRAEVMPTEGQSGGLRGKNHRPVAADGARVRPL